MLFFLYLFNKPNIKTKQKVKNKANFFFIYSINQIYEKQK